MVKGLFRSKKRLDGPDPDGRLAALAALTEPEARAASATLAALARDDEDPQVRRAALARLADPLELAALLSHPDLAGAAARRVMELLDRGQAMELADHPAVLLARLETSSTAEALEALVAGADQGLLVEAVILLPRARKEELLSMPAFQRAALLQELERRSRDRDKNSNRLARDRLERLRRHRAAAAGLLTRIEERLALLEKPAADAAAEQRKRRALADALDKDLAALAEPARVLDAAGEPLAGVDALHARRRALAEPPEPPAAGASGPRSEENTVTAPASSGAPEDAGEPGTAEERRPGGNPDADPDVDFDSLAASFSELELAMQGPTPFQELARRRQALTEAWLALADRAPPDDAQHRVFERASHRFQELASARQRLSEVTLPDIQDHHLPERITADTPAETWAAADALRRAAQQAGRLVEAIDWPAWAAVPPPLAELRRARDALTSRLARWDAAVEANLSHIDELLRLLEERIDAGELKEARATAGTLRNLLKPLPERLARRPGRALRRASARLGELGDWQAFATSPKRQALLESMRALADNPLDPKDQAERIKTLRAQWNELGPLGRARDRQLLEAFNEAAERAFEPCRAYFAQQAELRSRNLAARKEICESLARYLAETDWQRADYKAAERIMRTARQEWRRFHPVERGPGKGLEKRFEALQAELHGHIKAEWERNLEAKRHIVHQAQDLVGQEMDPRDKAEKAKELQRAWRAVGPTPRRPDQLLWREFRDACDAIFAARDDTRKRADERIRNHRQAAEQLLADFRAQLDEHGSDLTPAAIRDYQARFADLPELPERGQRQLQREFDALLRTAQLLQRERRAAAHRERLARLEAQDGDVSELEARMLAGKAIAFEPPDPLFAGRCQHNAAPVSREALTRLVIEAEIAAGLESPESELRMAIQVELMNSGRGRQALEAAPEELVARWCATGPRAPDCAGLRERFFAAIHRLSGH